MKRKVTREARLIARMLTENTGSHFLDSGGAYGRHWEHNKTMTARNFLDQETVKVERDDKDGSLYGFTLSTFHYIESQVTLDSICDKFNRLNTNPSDLDYENESNLHPIYGVSIKAGEYLDSVGYELVNTVNSYNGDSCLSQVIQYSVIKIEFEWYLILQIHGGCDVRGGYTDAKMFKLTNEWDGFLAPEDIYGVLNGKLISNTYDGYSLRFDDDDSEHDSIPELTKSDVIELWACEY